MVGVKWFSVCTRVLVLRMHLANKGLRTQNAPQTAHLIPSTNVRSGRLMRALPMNALLELHRQRPLCAARTYMRYR